MGGPDRVTAGIEDALAAISEADTAAQRINDRKADPDDLRDASIIRAALGRAKRYLFGARDAQIERRLRDQDD